MEGNSGPLEIYYDGDCTVCRRIASRLLRSSQGTEFSFRNIRSGALPKDVSMEDAIRDVHAVSRGTVYAGGDVLFAIAQRYPRWSWFSKGIAVAPVRGVVRRAYRLLAEHRPFFSRFI